MKSVIVGCVVVLAVTLSLAERDPETIYVESVIAGSAVPVSMKDKNANAEIDSKQVEDLACKMLVYDSMKLRRPRGFCGPLASLLFGHWAHPVPSSRLASKPQPSAIIDSTPLDRTLVLRPGSLERFESVEARCWQGRGRNGP